MSVLDRFALTADFKREKADVFIHTPREVENMVTRDNSLVLSALLEGIPLVTCEYVERLREKTLRMYKRSGRVWIRVE